MDLDPLKMKQLFEEYTALARQAQDLVLTLTKTAASAERVIDRADRILGKIDAALK